MSSIKLTVQQEPAISFISLCPFTQVSKLFSQKIFFIDMISIMRYLLSQICIKINACSWPKNHFNNIVNISGIKS